MSVRESELSRASAFRALPLVLRKGFVEEAGFDTVSFNVVFGSEEFPESVPEFVDGFGMFLNGTNIALVDLLPVNVSDPLSAVRAQD